MKDRGDGESCVHHGPYLKCAVWERQFIHHGGRGTRKKGRYKILIPWRGKAEELSVNFVKVFHVSKFQVLNLSSILLIASLEKSVLTTDVTAPVFAPFDGCSAGWGGMSALQFIYSNKV